MRYSSTFWWHLNARKNGNNSILCIHFGMDFICHAFFSGSSCKRALTVAPLFQRTKVIQFRIKVGLSLLVESWHIPYSFSNNYVNWWGKVNWMRSWPKRKRSRQSSILRVANVLFINLQRRFIFTNEFRWKLKSTTIVKIDGGLIRFLNYLAARYNFSFVANYLYKLSWFPLVLFFASSRPQVFSLQCVLNSNFHTNALDCIA